ncbi:MAG: type II toxin-antitoxin system RelE/ParE family toxin [Candidatus Peregrinibacteria bacterium]
MYSVELRPKARKALARLPREHQERIAVAIDTLSEDPFIGKKLEGKFRGAWTLRVWPYRIIYRIDRRVIAVEVLNIGHRQGVYK